MVAPGHDGAVTLQQDLEAIANEIGFSGVAVASVAGRRVAELAQGDADRAARRSISLATRFGIASVTKGFTALTVASLIEAGALTFDTTLRSLLPEAMPLADERVTIEHLLAHTSGVGDYLDEDVVGDVDEYVMTLPVHVLDSPAAYLPAMAGLPQRTPPGAAFAYNNGGYVLLSIAAERATGRSWYDLVAERVFEPAGMVDSGFDRSDRPAPDSAVGYLADGRTNVLHLPVRGAGDGGAYSTANDLEALWTALFAGRIVSSAIVDRLTSPRPGSGQDGFGYGSGFWLGPPPDLVMLEGMDAGISCRTGYEPPRRTSYAVLANTSAGAWPLARFLAERLPSV